MKLQNPYWPRISVSLYYDDPGTAIDWLCRAFGFEVRLRVDGDDGQVIHSELMLGDGLIMVGPASPKPFRKSPRAIESCNTADVMVHVEHAKAHCERARAAGAKISQEPTVSDYGEEYWADLCYEAVDPEGHRWWFAERVRDHGVK